MYILTDKQIEIIDRLLNEMDGITIMADSPDSNNLIKENPSKACKCMMDDITALSNYISDIQDVLNGTSYLLED